jgi:hypothetical protein
MSKEFSMAMSHYPTPPRRRTQRTQPKPKIPGNHEILNRVRTLDHETFNCILDDASKLYRAYSKDTEDTGVLSLVTPGFGNLLIARDKFGLFQKKKNYSAPERLQRYLDDSGDTNLNSLKFRVVFILLYGKGNYKDCDRLEPSKYHGVDDDFAENLVVACKEALASFFMERDSDNDLAVESSEAATSSTPF